MDPNKRNCLLQAGVNVDEALERFMQNEALLLKYLRRLPADPTYAALCQALDRQDAQAAFAAAHTLKGLAGNLSLQQLYTLVSLQVEQLRGGDLSGAAETMPRIRQAYEAAVQAVEAL